MATRDPASREPAPAAPADTARLEREIAETRRKLGETVQALAHKADVKAQAQEKVEALKTQVHERQEQAKAKADDLGAQARDRPAPAALAGGLFAFVLLLLWWRKA